MNKRVRHALLVAAALLFAAVAPSVVLYAIGYRPFHVDPNGSAVGALHVIALPSKTQLIVNGEESGKVPRRITNVKSGPVTIELTKPGYSSWRKTLLVEPTLATEIDAARLFPQTPQVSQILEGVRDFSVSPSRSMMAALNDNLVWQIIDLSGKPISPEIQLAAQPRSVIWSPDNSHVLLELSDNQYYVYDVSATNSNLVRLAFLSKAEQVAWDLRIPGMVIAKTLEGDIISGSVSNGVVTNVAEQAEFFALSTRQIIVYHEDKRIVSYNRQGETGGFEIIPEVIPRELLVTPQGAMAFISNDGQLYYVNNDNVAVKVADTVTKAGWSPDGQMLLLQMNNNELSVYNASNDSLMHLPMGQLQLILRLSSPITDSQWYAGGHHIIYQTNDEIVITEIDIRDHPVSYVVDTTNNGSSKTAVGENGDEIYYLKTLAGRTGIYKAQLLLPEDR